MEQGVQGRVEVYGGRAVIGVSLAGSKFLANFNREVILMASFTA
jgi:hypothetical protein